MNAAATQPDKRNRWGFPRGLRNTLRNLIRTRGHVTADQSIGKNDALPWVVLVAIVACSMSGIGLGLSIGARDTANEAKRIADRETRLQRLELDEVKVALQTQGIKVHEGSTP